MELNKFDEGFLQKYQEEAEDKNYLYEYKTGEFQGGEIIGMQTLPNQCGNIAYIHEKDTKQEYIQALEFYGEEGYRENDLQIPICNNC